MKKPENIDAYTAAFPADIQKRLEQMRSIIQSAAPDAEEVISYGMPAFKLNGMLVYYAANKSHIGFYPTSSPIRVFSDDLTGYQTSKGAIQFPFTKPIPVSLVKKIVKFRVLENREKAARKKTK